MYYNAVYYTSSVKFCFCYDNMVLLRKRCLDLDLDLDLGGFVGLSMLCGCSVLNGRVGGGIMK